MLTNRRPGSALLVGKHSFLAGRFLALRGDPNAIRAASHSEIVNAADLRDAGLIVNFAIHPDYRRTPYSEELDFDLHLARLIGNRPTTYVMLSTRAVYPKESAFPASEEAPATGANLYGRNKAQTERALADLLGKRLTVLRIANVMGYEAGLGRRTFMGIALDRLREKGEIQLDISPLVRRDFIPDDRFAATLSAVLDQPKPGPLNVGSGVPCPLSDIVAWLIEGFGSGHLIVESAAPREDDFVLDVSKLEATYGIKTTLAEIRTFCIGLGRQLRPRSVSPP